MRSFSEVCSSEAHVILDKLGLSIAIGQEAPPQWAQVACPGASAEHASSSVCHDFDISAYPSAHHATPALVEHHQQQLAQLGVPFGRGGFKVYDVHECEYPLLTLNLQSTRYQGTFDGGVAPYGLIMPSSAWVCRVLYEHKASKVRSTSCGSVGLVCPGVDLPLWRSLVAWADPLT